MKHQDLDIDVYHEGVYYQVQAEVYKEGEYEVVQDAGVQWYNEIQEEPEFSNVCISDYEDNKVDNPDDKLSKAVNEMLKEVYWNLTLNL